MNWKEEKKKEFEEKFTTQIYDDSESIIPSCLKILKNNIAPDNLWVWIESTISDLLKKQREMPEIKEYLNKLEGELRSATCTPDNAVFILDSSGRCRITFTLNSFSPQYISVANLDELYKFISAPEPK